MSPKQQCSNITPRRNVPGKRRSISGKENNDMEVHKLSSGKKVEQMINEMRISACKTITNFKSSLGDMSNKFKRSSTLRTRNFSKLQHYREIDEQVTPVKLYSPFTFVTPSPDKSVRKRSSPRRVTFISPTGKFQKDVQQLSKEVKELEKVEKSLCLRKFR